MGLDILLINRQKYKYIIDNISLKNNYILLYEKSKRYFIPIIGTVSSGKSTLLNVFLRINVLQTDEVITTKFICLIKNSHKSTFYQVIPKREKEIHFQKEGEETKGKANIKKRIEEINKKLSIKHQLKTIFLICLKHL